jgi:hypothetical protein
MFFIWSLDNTYLGVWGGGCGKAEAYGENSIGWKISNFQFSIFNSNVPLITF